MHFEEKIQRLKLEFSSKDFKVPFTEGSDILKSIEKEFIIVKDLTNDLNNLRQYHSNWAESMKAKIKIKSVSLTDYKSWLDKLDPNVNYWTVITLAKHYVYDCKPNSLKALVSFWQDDFFIVDKKYNWLSYFEVDKKLQMATVYKSGNNQIPFEIS